VTTLTGLCDSSQVCNRDTCARFHVVNTFNSALQLVAVETCTKYSVQTADYRDGYSRFTLVQGQVFDSCQLSFVNDNDYGSGDDLTACNDCRICDGTISALLFEIDCSNIKDVASTDGCTVIEAETDAFPAFESELSSASGGPTMSLLGFVGAASVLFSIACSQ